MTRCRRSRPWSVAWIGLGGTARAIFAPTGSARNAIITRTVVTANLGFPVTGSDCGQLDRPVPRNQ